MSDWGWCLFFYSSWINTHLQTNIWAKIKVTSCSIPKLWTIHYLRMITLQNCKLLSYCRFNISFIYFDVDTCLNFVMWCFLQWTPLCKHSDSKFWMNSLQWFGKKMCTTCNYNHTCGHIEHTSLIIWQHYRKIAFYKNLNCYKFSQIIYLLKQYYEIYS